MSLFLDRPTLYRLLMRELPEDVYPDSGRPEDFWSTASIDAKAETIKNAYAALEQAYDNYWPQTADAVGIAQHELAHRGSLSAGLDLQERRDRVLARMQALPSMSRPDLVALVKSELPADTIVTIVGLNDDSAGEVDAGTWFLGVSELGIDTYLGAYGSHAYPPGTDVCEMDGSAIGMSPDEWIEYQTQAYTYEVRIWDYTPSADELAAIDRELTEAESADSTHTIVLRTTVLERMEDLPSTSLHLEADYYDGGATWLDSSGSGNHAVAVGTPAIEASPVFDERMTMRANASSGFHAPGDDVDALTERTYELVVDDFSNTTSGEPLLARNDGSLNQIAYWLWKNNATQLEADVYDSTHTQPWMGSTAIPIANTQGLPVIFHIVVDAPNRTVKVYRNAVLLVNSNNYLFGSLATPTGLHLGIFRRYTQSGFATEYFHGTIMEVLRHEVAMDAATITARASEFNRLKGY